MDGMGERAQAAPLPSDRGDAVPAADGASCEVAPRIASGHQLQLITLGGQGASQGLVQDNTTSFFQPAVEVLQLLNRNDRSFYIFSRRSYVRKACLSLTGADAFGKAVLLLVFLSCITLAMDPGPCDMKCRDSEYMQALYITDTIFTACFTLEILCQAIAHCFLLGPSAYLHNGWNWIDLVSTVSGYVVFLPVMDGSSGLNELRGLRALRPLRALKAIPGLRRLVQCLLEVVPLLLDVLFLLVWVFFAFGIIALNVFMSALHSRCVYYVANGTAPAAGLLPPLAAPPWSNGSSSSSSSAGGSGGFAGSAVTGAGVALAPLAALLSGSHSSNGSSNSNTSSSSNAAGGGWMFVPGWEDMPCSSSGSGGASKCPGEYDGFAVSCQGRYGNPNFGYTGFDNFGMASFNIFAVLTLDGWSQLQLYPLWSALGPGLPIAFFSLLVLFGAFFAMQLVVAVMSSKFAQLEAMARSPGPVSRTNTTANLQQLEDTEERDTASTSRAVATAAPPSSTHPAPPRSVAGRAAAALVAAAAAAAQRYGALKRAVGAWVYDFKLRHMQPLHRVRMPLWRRRTYSVLHHGAFARTMTVLIVINTVALAMDHYGIGPTLGRAIDITNNILSCIFIVELVLKHVAVGFLRYWTDPWDILDGVVVGVSIAEFILVATGGGKTGTQALRTLRVLRILRTLKLLRRIKSLHRLIKMVLRGFYALGNFLLLTSLFIFIFSVLGLHQFGGLWSFQPAANTDDPDSARSNFNTLWEAGYTVFQILTCDDWLRIAWNGMRGSGNAAVLYFAVWVVIGNFVLLSLFLAILITSFNAEAEEEEDLGTESGGTTDTDGEPYNPGVARSSVATVDSRQQPTQTLRRRRRGGAAGGGAEGASNSTTIAAGAGGGAAATANANALHQRIVERVSERLDPARVKIMKRWLVMIGVTHGMGPDEVEFIVKELDARVSFDPDSVRLDSSFTSPQRLHRRSVQLGGGLHRISTLRRSAAAQAVNDEAEAAATAPSPLPPPEESTASDATAQQRCRTSAGSSSLRRISAIFSTPARAVDGHGRAATASGDTGCLEYGITGVDPNMVVLGHSAELSPRTTKGSLRCVGLPSSPFAAAAAAAAVAAEAEADGNSNLGGGGGDADGGGGRSSNPLYCNPGPDSTTTRGVATPPRTSASAPLSAVLQERPSGSIATVLERFAHAVRKLAAVTNSSGTPTPRQSAPGGSRRGDTATLPLVSPPNGAAFGGSGRRSASGMYTAPRQRACYSSYGGAGGGVAASGLHHHHHHPNNQAQHNRTRLGRSPAALQASREDSWDILLPRSEKLLRYQRMMQQHQHRLEDAWAQERLRQWLLQSHLALLNGSMERQGGDAVVGGDTDGGGDREGDWLVAASGYGATGALPAVGAAGAMPQRPSRFAVAASAGRRTDTGDGTSGGLPASDGAPMSECAVVSRTGLAEEGDGGHQAGPPPPPGSRFLARNRSAPAFRAATAGGGETRVPAVGLLHGTAARLSPGAAAAQPRLSAVAAVAAAASDGSLGMNNSAAAPAVSLAQQSPKMSFTQVDSGVNAVGSGGGSSSGLHRPMAHVNAGQHSGLSQQRFRAQIRHQLYSRTNSARNSSGSSLGGLLPPAQSRPTSQSQRHLQSQSPSQSSSGPPPRRMLLLLSQSNSSLQPRPPPPQQQQLSSPPASPRHSSQLHHTDAAHSLFGGASMREMRSVGVEGPSPNQAAPVQASAAEPSLEESVNPVSIELPGPASATASLGLVQLSVVRPSPLAPVTAGMHCSGQVTTLADCSGQVTTLGDCSGQVSGTGVESHCLPRATPEAGVGTKAMEELHAGGGSAGCIADAAGGDVSPFAVTSLTPAAVVADAAVSGDDGLLYRQFPWRGSDSSCDNGCTKGGCATGGRDDVEQWLSGYAHAFSSMNPCFEHCEEGGPGVDQRVASTTRADSGGDLEAHAMHMFTGVYGNPLARHGSSSGTASPDDTYGHQPWHSGCGPPDSVAGPVAATSSSPARPLVPMAASESTEITGILERRLRIPSSTDRAQPAAADIITAAATTTAAGAAMPQDDVNTAAQSSGIYNTGIPTPGHNANTSKPRGGPPAWLATAVQPQPPSANTGGSGGSCSIALTVSAHQYDTWSVGLPTEGTLAECSVASELLAGGALLPAPPPAGMMGAARVPRASAATALSPFTKCLSGRSENCTTTWRSTQTPSDGVVSSNPSDATGVVAGSGRDGTGGVSPSGAMVPPAAAPSLRRASLGKAATLAQAVSEPGFVRASQTAAIVRDELALQPGRRKQQEAAPSSRLRATVVEIVSPVDDFPAVAGGPDAVGADPAYFSKEMPVIGTMQHGAAAAAAEKATPVGGLPGNSCGGGLGTAVVGKVEGLDRVSVRGPVAEAVEGYGLSAVADGGVVGVSSSSCIGDPWVMGPGGRRPADVCLPAHGYCGVTASPVHGCGGSSAARGDCSSIGTCDTCAVVAKPRTANGASAAKRLLRTLFRLSVHRVDAATACSDGDGDGVDIGSGPLAKVRYPRPPASLRSSSDSPGPDAEVGGECAACRQCRHVSRIRIGCDSVGRGGEVGLRTLPGPLCEGLQSRFSQPPGDSASDSASAGRLGVAGDADPHADAGAGSAGAPVSPSLVSSTIGIPQRRFLRTFSAAASSASRSVAAAAAAVAATATLAGSDSPMERRPAGGVRGVSRRSLRPSLSLAAREDSVISGTDARTPPPQQQRRPPLPLLLLQALPRSPPPTERRAPPQRRLMHSASSRHHSSRAERLAAASAAAATRFSGSGVVGGSGANGTGGVEKWSVAWARAHGPCNAAEMEQALFAPLQLISASRSRRERQSGRPLVLEVEDGGVGSDGGSGNGSGSARVLTSSGRLTGAAGGGTDGGGAVRSRLGVASQMDGLRSPDSSEAVRRNVSGDGAANEIDVEVKTTEVAGGDGGGAEDDDGGGVAGGDGVVVANAAAIRPPALVIGSPRHTDHRHYDGRDGGGVDDHDSSGGSSNKGMESVYGYNTWGDPAPYLEYPAFCCIEGDSCVRQVASSIILHPWFDYGIMAVILASSAILAVDSPRLDESSPLGRAVSILDLIFTVVFTLEMVVRITAKGLVLHPHAYLRNGWDVLDFVIVATSLLSLGLGATHAGADGGGNNNGALKSVRLVRTLRPLRLMRRLRGMRRVVETLIRSLPNLFEVLLFGVFQFGLFGILGVQLFSGKMSVCSQPVINGTRVMNRAQCIQGVTYVCGDYDLCPEAGAEAVRWWGPPMRNFDHLGSALLTLFTVVTLDGYMEVARSCMDAVGVDQVPQENHAPYMGLYVLAFIFLGSFFLVNLLVSVIIDHYARIVAEEGDLLVSKQAKEYIRIFQFERNGKDLWKGGCPPEASRLRRFCWKIASHPRFDAAVTANIVINIVAMAAVYDNTPRAYDVALGLVNVACTCGFAVEAWFKMVALGPRKYIRDHWNKLDLFIIAVSIPDIMSTFTPMSAATGFVTVLRLLRVFRMFKLIKSARGLRTLFNTLISSSPAIANVGSLLLLIMYIYAVIGMNMYGNYGSAFDQPGSHATYNNIGAAMATQFRLFTGDGWGDLMATGMNCNANQYQCDTGPSALAAAMFFCSFVLVAIFIMLNLVIAVVVDNFIDNAQLEGLLKTNNFVDLLRMVITLRVFVLMMRHKIDTVRKHDRAMQLTTHGSSRLIGSRRARSRSMSSGTVSATPVSPPASGGRIGIGIGSSMSIAVPTAATALTPGCGGGLGGGSGIGVGRVIGGSSFIGSTSSISGLPSSSFLPRLARAISRMGIVGGGYGGISGNGFGSMTSADGSVITVDAGDKSDVAGLSRFGSRSSATKPSPSLPPSMQTTTGPILPRQQHSPLLFVAPVTAQRASMLEDVTSGDAPVKNSGGGGGNMLGVGKYVNASHGSIGVDGVGSRCADSPGGALAMDELREHLLRRRRRHSLMSVRKRRLRASSSMGAAIGTLATHTDSSGNGGGQACSCSHHSGVGTLLQSQVPMAAIGSAGGNSE